jgi:hypothetical protein
LTLLGDDCLTNSFERPLRREKSIELTKNWSTDFSFSLMNEQDGSSAPDVFVAAGETPVDREALTADQIRSALPECQPQEGSPANTFTDSELQELQAALPGLNLRPRTSDDGKETKKKKTVLDIRKPWVSPESSSSAAPAAAEGPQESPSLDWHGAPKFSPAHAPRDFRNSVRQGAFTGPTNGQCPGFLQCNLVVLPQGPTAFDFLLFCQRNPKACPLLEVCDVGSPVPVALAPHADLRTDVPKYVLLELDG